jgi:hypothetical protein
MLIGTKLGCQERDGWRAQQSLGCRTHLGKVDRQPRGFLAQVGAVVGRRRRRGPGPAKSERQLRTLGLQMTCAAELRCTPEMHDLLAARAKVASHT